VGLSSFGTGVWSSKARGVLKVIDGSGDVLTFGRYPLHLATMPARWNTFRKCSS
jgi:hypothetical protein